MKSREDDMDHAELRQHLLEFKIPRYTRTLTQWLNLILETGFLLEQIEEPSPSDEIVRQHPRLQSAQVVPSSLQLRARLPAGRQADVSFKT